MLVSMSYYKNIKGWLNSIGSRLYRSSHFSLFDGRHICPTLFEFMGISLRLGFLYSLLCIYICVLFEGIYKKKYMPVFSILLLLLGLSNIVVSIVGAQFNWARLILPSMPIYLLMLGQLC